MRQATWKPPKDSPHFDRAAKVGGQIEVAVKVISKKKLHGDFAPVHEEIEVLKGLDHANMSQYTILARVEPSRQCLTLRPRD